MRYSVAAILVVALATPIAAGAQQRTGYTQIAVGDYAKAERMLTAERRIFPERPELMLNLAAVYQRTNRTSEARTLYNDVLAQPDVLMDVAADRTAWSHGIARTGLGKLGGVQLSSR